jgi:lipopolysaccharide transport system permease protein
MFAMLKSLWAYRGFILGSVKREFQLKYRNSMLGIVWTVIQPLSMIIVYTVIFSQIMHAKLPGVANTFGYSIYLCAGVITWGLFAEIVSRSQTVFIDNANLLKKLNFPRLCLPVTLTLSAVMNFAIIFSLFVLLLLISNSFPGWVILLMLPVLIVQILFSIALGMTIGILNVFFRDIGQLSSMVLQFWFWLTPIIYPAHILPASIQPWLQLNPMYPIIAAYQGILVQGTAPQWSSLLPVLILALLLCIWSMRLFRKHSGDMVDEL